ncbi:hypothetical protein ILUMI_26485 [Ignelater luminosus]|uniref:Serpin domain-containing protein n=1 Tax=Ignelater luminosus TaxID=2038154 RepID=A0A8K0C5Q4_IGNLU|nr:hypothetical protein ILUMI_26485 [Ignelater luminosus]
MNDFVILLTLGIFSLSQAEESQVVKEFSTGYDRFSAGVYRELLKTNSGNFLVCPLSVDIVLALTDRGAKGQTAKEISETLGLPDSFEKVNEIFTTVALSLQSNDKYELSSANKVYVKEGFEICNNFKSTAVDVFKAEIQNIDFEKNVEAANEINKWVEDKTHEKIKDLISPGFLNKLTRSVLVNAIYFRGNWTQPFDEKATQKRPFYLNANKDIDTDMMLSYGHYYNYYESSKLNTKFLELPYEGEDISLHIVLPNERDGLAALEGKIEDVLIPPNYQSEEVNVELPKFKIESSIEFKPILKTLGIKLAFQDEADFSGIGAKRESLTISNVIQKAFIEVEEKGTTAAAASAVIVEEAELLEVSPIPPKEFYANHPFIFYLRLNKLGLNLFIGTYKSPQN